MREGRDAGGAATPASALAGRLQAGGEAFGGLAQLAFVEAGEAEAQVLASTLTGQAITDALQKSVALLDEGRSATLAA